MSEEITFNFCGIDSDRELNLIVNEIRRPVSAEISENVQDIPGMIGELFLGNSFGKKQFDIEVTLKADSENDRAKKLRILSNLIIQTGDAEYPMVFSDDSEWTYYGHFTGISQPERISKTSHWVSFTISFGCSDPKGYGVYEKNNMNKNPITLTPNGAAESYPIFTCLPKKPVTKIAITDQDGDYVYIGSEVDPDTGDTNIDLEPLVLHDPCNTLATWTSINSSNLTFELESGVPSGTMQSTPNSIRVGKTSDGLDNFGAVNPNNKWHGPIRQQWLPGSYGDFRIRVRMWNRQYYARARGKCEIYLLNATGVRIGKIMLKDNGNSESVYAQVQIGSSSNHHDLYFSQGTVKKGKKSKKSIKLGTGTKEVKSKGKTKTVQQWKTVKLDEDTTTSTFTDFYGYIELQKIGNKFTMEIMAFDEDSNPKWNKPISKTWTDSSKKYTESLAGIAFYTAKGDISEDKANPVKRYKNNGMGLADVKVWRIIDGGNKSSSSPTIIARPGDEVKINCEDRTIYKNGAYFMEKFYIGSKFQTLMGGIPTTLAFEPGLDDADWYYEIRPTTQ
ncbi:distal tail protein Dit [Bacillus sp. mrc49]|uniref:distal tail protein Dit n=1 Tax=Bacillus sp. mrc49 TaxID=2054913 RepID=UPI000C27C9C8|nr:distal tail protein Dit [Bacillus sp. mrc49]PJN90547.1 phage tail protein [Bacillus sp. mrc49]PJN91368.1 phage tail protein [Bacillus sp. mrc49]